MTSTGGKVVVITGASSGIGAALAEEFARKNFSVVIGSRDQVRLNNITKKIQQINPNVIDVICDVSIESDCRKLIDAAINKFGKIDVLINNAGISMRALF